MFCIHKRELGTGRYKSKTESALPNRCLNEVKQRRAEPRAVSSADSRAEQLCLVGAQEGVVAAAWLGLQGDVRLLQLQELFGKAGFASGEAERMLDFGLTCRLLWRLLKERTAAASRSPV